VQEELAAERERGSVSDFFSFLLVVVVVVVVVLIFT
jgi:hypothetical protein